MSTKRIALAAAAGSTMLFTDCASWFQFEPPTQDDLASRAGIQDRFDYFDDASYACNLYNTLSDGDSHCRSLDRHAGKANIPRSPDFATANRAASLAIAAGSMLGFVDGSGLIDVFSLGRGTPSHKGTLTAYENSVQGMFVIPSKDYPDASTAIRAYFKKLGSSIAQACKAIGCECERYDLTLGDFFAHKYAVHAGVEYICSQKNPVDSPRDVQLHMRVSLPKFNFWRQPEVVPAWMDEKQPSAFVATHIGWRSLLWYGIERRHKTHEERVDFILKEGRDTVKIMAALQKYLPQGVYLYVSPFQVGAGQFTVPYVMTSDKTWFFGRAEKKTSEEE